MSMEPEKYRFTEDQLLPLSALQHFLFCPRQCGLIHLEQVWEENRFTAEGRVMHERAHEGADESRPGLRITRGLAVRSLVLGVSGQCDVVEFHADGTILPIEYKRGKPKSHRADEVQLCGQALCLEEMLGRRIPVGALYYGKPHRRTEVSFDEDLRNLTVDVARRLHSMIAEHVLPEAVYEQWKCESCSLIDLCQPRARREAAAWFAEAVLS
jgi:CRISPR-associated exonuclease Cas4